jgi:hypothetical protein
MSFIQESVHRFGLASPADILVRQVNFIQYGTDPPYDNGRK